MQKKNITQENDIREIDFLFSSQSTNKKATAHFPSATSKLNECRFSDLQKPERKSDTIQE